MKNKTKEEITVEEWFRTVVGRLEKQDRFATGRNYRKTLCSLRLFLETERTPLSAITADTVWNYKSFLERRHACRNTVSFYIRTLRAACNKASEEGYNAPEAIVFKGVFTGVDATRKRALGKTLLRRIVALDLSGERELELSRDMFLFSLYARGMCFIDMARLSRDDIRYGVISYIRSKTGKYMSLHVEPCMQVIIDKWSSNATGGRLFPILAQTGTKEAFEEYEYRLCRHNLMLKEIGRRIKAPFPLSSYAARHSWATLARDLGVPISVISSGMGHTSEQTTRIYMAQLSNSRIDQANRKVINVLRE